MGTRFYFPATGAAAVSPAFASGWELTGAAIRRPATTARGSSAFTTRQVAESSPSVVDVLWAQYVSAPLAAQTIGGTIKGQFVAFESSLLADMRAQLVVKVVSNDGSVVRGTLLDFDAGGLWSEFETLGRNRAFPRLGEGAATLANLAVLDGDRIVFELGYRAHNFSFFTRSGSVELGDSAASDLPENETEAGLLNPWIELSQSLAFQGEALQNAARLDGVGALAAAATATAFAAAELRAHGLISVAANAQAAAAIDGLGRLDVSALATAFGAAELRGYGALRVTGLVSAQGLSAPALAGVLAQETGEAYLLLLTITHASLATPIRVVNDHANLVSRGATYVAYPFEIDLPDDAPGEAPRVRLRIDNIGVPDSADPLARRVSDYIRAIDSPFTAALEVVLASTPDLVEAGPFTLTAQRAEYDAQIVSAELAFEDVLNEPYPGDSFTPASHPGLF
jgi:hypothetical protein